MMRNFFLCLIGACVGFAAVSEASDTPSETSPLYGLIDNAPPGYWVWCASGPGMTYNPEQCPIALGDQPRVATVPEWEKGYLHIINGVVNAKYAPATDQEMYGAGDFWTHPTTHADCEDYVIAKRQILLDRGYPPASLRFVYVITEQSNARHLVLEVHTTQGVFVLDNLTRSLTTRHTVISAQDENLTWQIRA